MSESFPVTWNDPSDAALTWEWDDEHLPQALTPLAGDWACTWTGGFAYRAARAGLKVQIEYRIINGYAYAAERFLAPEPKVRAKARAFRQAQAQTLHEDWEGTVLPTFLKTYGRMRGLPIESAALPAVADACDRYWGDLPRLWGLHFMTASAADQALDDLREAYAAVVDGGTHNEALQLVLGQSTLLHAVQRDLYRLSETARASTVAPLIVENPQAALAALSGASADQPGFVATLHAFLETHGHLGQPSDDLIHPCWSDEPSVLLAEIRKHLLEPPEDPDLHRQRLAAEAEARVGRVRVQLASRPDAARRFEEALALARRVGWLTEGHNYWLDRMLQAHTRWFALRTGRRLVDAGVLNDATDIFFLHAHETGAALRQPEDLRTTVAQRKAEHARWSAVRPPKHLGALPPSPVTEAPAGQPTASAPRVLRGIAASPGVARGPARVVRTPAEFGRVTRGDILVCPAANPSWVPLFPIIAGLVTDAGGALSHAAVVAREFGIPAVVGAGDATKRIREDQLVEVNGTAGEVWLPRERIEP